MSPTDDTQPNRGRPVLKAADHTTIDELTNLLEAGLLWIFCGEFEGRESDAVDAAAARKGNGIYKSFPSGSWPGGYLRD